MTARSVGRAAATGKTPAQVGDRPDGVAGAPETTVAHIDEQEIHLSLLIGRLLLEYSEATPRVEGTLYALAANLGRKIRVTGGYLDLTIYLLNGGTIV